LRGLALLDDSLDVGPEPARVGGAESATGCAEGLAGYPRANEEIRDSTPRSPVERGDVRKDSRVVQGARFNLPNQVRGGEGFPLHHTHKASSRSRDSDSESEGQSGIPGT